MTLKRSAWIAWCLTAAVVATCLVFGGPQTGFAQSATECDDYAKDYANRHTNAGADVVGGAVAGAASGALIGGIVGGGRGAGKGAAIGAGVGAVSGGAHHAGNWQYHYDVAYRNCMRGNR